MAISHAGHNHPATPAARSACRKSNGNPNVTRIESDGYVARAAKSEIRMTGAVARRMARTAMKAENMRIQPRRSGARVAIDDSGCVQAALHIDAHGGRCACGWTAQLAA